MRVAGWEEGNRVGGKRGQGVVQEEGVSRCQGTGAGLWQGGIVSGGALSFKDLLDDQPIPSSFLHPPPAPSVSSAILPSTPSFQLSTDSSSLRPSSVFRHVHPTHSSTLVGKCTLDHHTPGHPEATTHPSSRCNSLVPFPQDSSQSLSFLEPLVQGTSASEIQQPIVVENEQTEQTLDHLQLFPRQTFASKVRQPLVLGTSPSSFVPLAFTTIPQSQFPSALSGLHHPKPEPEVIKNCQSERGNWSFLDLVNRKEDGDEDETKNKEGKTKEDVKGKDKEVFQYPFDKLASVHKNALRSKNAESASSRIKLQDLPKLTSFYPDIPELTPICSSLKLPHVRTPTSQKSSRQGNPETRSVSPKSSQVTQDSSPNTPKNWLRGHNNNSNNKGYQHHHHQHQQHQQHQLDPISSLIAATTTNTDTSTTTTLRDILDYYNTNTTFLTQPRDLQCPKIKEGTTPPPPEESNSNRASLEYITSQTGWYQDNWSAMVYYANMQYLNQCSSVHGVALDDGVTYMVQWLMDNYETAEGVSLPRSTLYNHYLRHCADNKLDPVNAASFGKLIRSVFLGLRTRRLGTRGNSKYHYYGIRIKPTSPLINVNDDGSPITIRSSSGHLKKSGQQAATQQTAQQTQQTTQQTQQNQGKVTSSGQKNADTHYDSHTQVPAEASPQTLQNQQYLGDVSTAIPQYEEIDYGSSPMPTGVTCAHLDTFTTLYKEHSETILEAVFNLQFTTVEALWKRFWLMNNNNSVSAVSGKSSSSEISDDDEGDLASLLPSSVLQALLRSPPVMGYVRNFDYKFYQNLVDVLIPDVLRSIPSSLTQAIRNFAKSLESWLYNAMLGCPQELVNIKVTAVASLAQTLRRYTSLNHLAQAARAVLQNSTQISQMLADLNRVDFHNVQEQASWVCQCDVGMVDRLEEDFKATLQQQNSLEQWADWLRTVVTRVLRPHEGKADFPKHARQFLLKWSFYSSMVIRDLTLRSAASFGSFHLIRLLYDEYMFYLVEHKVATSLRLTPIAVISQGYNNRGSDPTSYYNGDTVSNHRQDEAILPTFKRLKYETS
ncbi:hypothetical protein Pcinc_023352 [Petrolisthes cinctipes]|uniref:RFX-type winged-helix domain-containing protein n=1 Tax=Petrolisthes cinctipes TaxID=88211 RepID=A0AAE1KGZ5_PETCI|nr:hypothetical protein Pcinc_023352 [Petrolisthes cinctipes]